MNDQVVSSQLSVVSCRSRIGQQRTTDHRPRTSAFRTPPSAQPPAPGSTELAEVSPQTPRSAITLTEVLISMGILTVGLLGVAFLFPVGSFYMQKAETADRGSAIAQSVMSDIMAKGMLNPRTWMVMTPNSTSLTPGAWNYRYMTIDGKYTPVRAPISATFTRPFGETLSEGLKLTTDPTKLTRQFGSAFVLDPMGIAAAAAPSTPINNNRIAYAFPASALFLPAMGTYYSSSAWNPWRVANVNDLVWPIRRVTFQQSDGWQMNPTIAEHYCRANDDLATDLPQRDDRPATQNWDMDNTNIPPVPLARQWTGDYSWIVTVAPTTNAARDGMARNPESFAYDVSVVVFHKRTLPGSPPQTNAELLDTASRERSVNGRILSTGLNGGEVLLKHLGDNTASPFEQLKTGQWIMLCGPHPNSTTGEPRFVLNWYQVLAIDSGPTDAEPIIAVRGPQWPWQPATNLTNWTNLSNNLCVGICRGAVAVHTKTIRLESPRGSWGSGMTLVTPPTVTPPPVTIY